MHVLQALPWCPTGTVLRMIAVNREFWPGVFFGLKVSLVNFVGNRGRRPRAGNVGRVLRDCELNLALQSNEIRRPSCIEGS